MTTLQTVFGSNATQTSTTITLSKADLDAIVPGYTPTAEDRGDLLAVALLYVLGLRATESVRGVNPDLRLTVTYAGYDVVSRASQPDTPYDRRDLFTAVFYSPQAAAPFTLS